MPIIIIVIIVAAATIILLLLSIMIHNWMQTVKKLNVRCLSHLHWTFLQM
jgi:hypothetical protein